MHLLFWLSLVPFGTAWIGETAVRPVPDGGLWRGPADVRLLPTASSCSALRARPGPVGHARRRRSGSDIKGWISPLFYLAAIPIAFVAPLRLVRAVRDRGGDVDRARPADRAPHRRLRPRPWLVVGAVAVGLAVAVAIDIARAGGLDAWRAARAGRPAFRRAHRRTSRSGTRSMSTGEASTSTAAAPAARRSSSRRASGRAPAGGRWLFDDAAQTTRTCAWDRPGSGRAMRAGCTPASRRPRTFERRSAQQGSEGRTSSSRIPSAGSTRCSSTRSPTSPDADGVAGVRDARHVRAASVWIADDPALDAGDSGQPPERAGPDRVDDRGRRAARLGADADRARGDRDPPGRHAPAGDRDAPEVRRPGAAGAVSPRRQRGIARSSSCYPNGRVEVVPDAGHLIHFDQPELVAARVQEVVTAVRSRAGRELGADDSGARRLTPAGMERPGPSRAPAAVGVLAQLPVSWLSRPPVNMPSVTKIAPSRPIDTPPGCESWPRTSSRTLVALDLEQHRRREVAGLEARLEREPAVLGDLVDVQRPVPVVERDVEDRGEARLPDAAIRVLAARRRRPRPRRHGLTRQMCAVPGVPGKPISWPTYAQPSGPIVDRRRDGLGGHLRREAGDDVRDDLDRPARDRHRVALGRDPEQVVAGRVGDEDVDAQRREAVRVRLAGVRRDVLVGRVDVDRLVGEDVEDGLGCFARGRLPVEDAVGADAPARAVRGAGDVGEPDRIGGRLRRAAIAAGAQVLEHRDRAARPSPG